MKFKSGFPMQLDVFLEKEKLALEYQGQHHYYDIFSLGPQWRHRERDSEKRQSCEEHGVTLVPIPYWWDGRTESLQATIHKARSDLLTDSGEDPIPQVPPDGLPASIRCSV